jgi:hypothetical protein
MSSGSVSHEPGDGYRGVNPWLLVPMRTPASEKAEILTELEPTSIPTKLMIYPYRNFVLGSREGRQRSPEAWPTQERCEMFIEYESVRPDE